MEITKFDVIFTTSMVLATVIMGVVFPYVGLAAAEPTTASDVPLPDLSAFDVNTDGVEQPDRPLGADADRMTVYEGGVNDLQIYSDIQNGNYTYVEAYGYTNLTDVILVWETDTNRTQTNVGFTGGEVGVTKTLNIDDQYIVDATLEEYEDNATANNSDRYQIRIKQVEIASQSSSGFFTWAVNAGYDVGRTVIWVGQVIRWGIAVAIAYLNAALSTTVANALWIIELFVWISTGYYTLITSAQSFAFILIMIPTIGIAIETIKFLIIVAEALPTT